MTCQEEYWKSGEREICYIYSDEYGIQHLFFWVLGNKRLKLSSFSKVPHRLKFLKTLRDVKLGPEWKRLEEKDWLFG